MNRLFDGFFADFPLAVRGGESLLAGSFVPRVDVSETDREIRVSAELPGMDEKEITVELDDAFLTIRGERREEKEEKGRNWHTREQACGSFNRIVPLPASVIAAKARATFSKGVLNIVVPKREEEQQERRKVIRIESA